MNQQRFPDMPAQPPPVTAVEAAYRQGYLEGHLAGWLDAIAAQAQAPAPVAQAPEVAQGTAAPGPAAPVAMPGPAGPVPAALPAGPAATRVPAASPAIPRATSSPQPPNVMPRHPQHPRRPQQPQQPRQFQQSQPPWQLQQPQPRSVPAGPAEIAARKSRRETQNINITLYVASLLMVAAAALFVGSSQPVSVRLVGVWLATVLFYGVGLVLHGKVERLKPAAVAFAGTGLAIIPFAGLATYNLGFPNAPAVWLATSFIGTVAYVVAAVRLRSRLVAYLSLAFLLSSAWSTAAVMGAALAWYFAALIIFSAVMALAGRLLAKGGPELNLFTKPLNDLGPWFAPVGLAGSLVFSLQLNAADHTLVLVAGVIYYAITVAICTPALRRWNYWGLRLSATLAAPFAGWLLQAEYVWAVGAFTLVLAAQIIVLAYRRTVVANFLGRPRSVDWDIFTSLMVLAASSALWTAELALPAALGAPRESFAAWGLLVGLATAMAVVPAFLPKGEWLPLPAAAATLLCWPFLGASDWLAVLFLGLVHAIFRHIATRRSVMGHAMLMVARVLATALVAAGLARFIPAQPGKVHLILAVVALVAALQLLTDALLARIGAANPLSNYAAATWSVVGTVIVVLLAIACSFTAHDGKKFLGTAPLPQLQAQFLLAALAMGLATAAFCLIKLPRTQGYSRAEFMAPSYFVVAGLCSGLVFDAAGASAAWGAGFAYLFVAGTLLRAHKQTMHRWIYWWGGRAVSLVLATALFQWWMENDSTTSLGGTHTGLGAVLLAALLSQLLILVMTALQGRGMAALSIDAAVTLLVVVLVSGAAILTGDAGLWTTRAAVVLAAAGVAAVSVTGTIRRLAMPAVLWAGPGALVFLVMLSLQNRPLAIMVLGIATATFAVLAAQAASSMLRGIHFLLARIAVTVLIALVAAEFTDDTARRSLALTAVLLGQLGLQGAAAGVARFNSAVGEKLTLRAGLWLVLAAQVMVPVAYVLKTRGFETPGTGLRWVVAVELLALAGSALLAQFGLKERGA